MNQYFLVVFVGLLVHSAVNAQCVLNGGFEQWDSTFVPPAQYPTPIQWQWALPTVCGSNNYLTVPATPANTGSFSAKLEAQLCTISPLGTFLQCGIVFSGDINSLSARHLSFSCNSRPTHIDFQYMFHQEGNDSGFVKVVLFNYDSITPGTLPYWSRVDTVAFASGYMHQEVTNFTLFSLPINYLKVDTPAFIHIYFSTSKTVAEAFLGTPTPYVHAYPGTTLWLDDVHISTSGLGVPDNTIYKEPLFFPNPVNDVLYFREPQRSSIQSVRVTDLRGRNTLYQVSPTVQPLFIGDLPTGMYFVRCTLSNGLEIINKLLVQ